MVPFAGWEMPVSYAGTIAEVAAVRSSAGLFDVSHMGEVSVAGEGAFDFVQHVTTNDVSKLSPGKAQYSLLLNEDGGVVDDIIVYCRNIKDYFIVLNAGCKDKDWEWLNALAASRPNMALTDISDKIALIAVQGPNAVEITARVAVSATLTDVKRFHFIHSDGTMLYSRTGYTGEDGFEIFCDWEDAPMLWQSLIEAGATPAGLGARDVLRLEAAYPLYGHELDAEISPFESGVGWAVKMNKSDFVGRESLQHKSPKRKLVGLRMNERAIPREQYAVLSPDGQKIGQATSGTWSPTVKAGISLARLEAHSTAPGTRVSMDIRGRLAPATVVTLPFYRNGV